MPKVMSIFPVVAIQRLQKAYGVSRKCATAIFQKQQEKKNGDEHDALTILQLLQKWNLDIELVAKYPQILKRPPFALDHHKHILEECGIMVGVSSLAMYLRINRSFMFALETHGTISSDRDVIERLCQAADLPSPDDVRASLDNVGSRPLLDVRLAVFRRYLRQRLDCSEEAADTMVARYPRNRHKSLRLTARVLDVLERQRFSADKIVRNPYLLNTHPDQLEALLQKCPTVASTDIGHLMQRVPRITYMPWHNTAAIVRHLDEYGFTEKAVLTGAEIFTLSADTVRQRLELMSQIPELWAMRHNKNFLRMIYSFQRTLGRLSYMRSVNMRCLSVHMLSTFYPHFRRYVSTGEDKSGGSDMVTYLSERLQLPPARVGHQLRQHPFWRSVPLPSVSETTEALLAAGFSVEQLRHALQLCLYPEGRALRAARPAAAADAVPEPFCLQLALYALERDGHFSGTAVFEFAAERRPAGAEPLGLPAGHGAAPGRTELRAELL